MAVSSKLTTQIQDRVSSGTLLHTSHIYAAIFHNRMYTVFLSLNDSKHESLFCEGLIRF
jgi:hypothetical protein